MRYRDTQTGKFVSASTWRRSRSHGGTRYKRIQLTFPGRVRLYKPQHMALAAPPDYERETGVIPAEFLAAADDYFESGEEYDFPEEDEY